MALYMVEAIMYPLSSMYRPTLTLRFLRIMWPSSAAICPSYQQKDQCHNVYPWNIQSHEWNQSNITTRNHWLTSSRNNQNNIIKSQRGSRWDTWTNQPFFHLELRHLSQERASWILKPRSQSSSICSTLGHSCWWSSEGWAQRFSSASCIEGE